MPKRRSDADFRRLLDQYPKIRISRFRATGVVDPSRNYVIICRIGGKASFFPVPFLTQSQF
jgi:hypothetical protein